MSVGDWNFYLLERRYLRLGGVRRRRRDGGLGELKRDKARWREVVIPVNGAQKTSL